MGKPRSEVKNENYYLDTYFLFEIFSQFKNPEECKSFLKDILTPSELKMLKRRWHIACLLNEGYDIRSTAKEADVSTETVVKIKKVLKEGRGGLLKALEKVQKKKVPSYLVAKEKSTRFTFG